MSGELLERWRQAQARMAELEIDALLVGPSPDMAYLTGFGGRQSERLLLLFVPSSGEPRLLLPSFEAPRFSGILGFCDASLWSDGADPAKLLGEFVPPGLARIGLGSDLFVRSALQVLRHHPNAEFIDADVVLGGLRARKSPIELSCLRRAAAAVDATLGDLELERIAGLTESELAAFLTRRLLENGHDTATHAMVAFGANAAVPHHHPSREQLAAGPVLIDLGGTVDGYHSDLSRTAAIGNNVEPELIEVYECVQVAHAAALAKVRPGVLASEIDAAARTVITEAGYGQFFTHRVGHGVGLDVHERPYLVAGNQAPIEPTMVFSIEPGIYIPGRFGVRIEDIVTVTSDGAERLNCAPHELLTFS